MSSLLKTFVIALSLCTTICSCNKDTTSGMDSVLSAADSLLSASPEKALEYLDSIASMDFPGAGQRATYNLLHTEARYQCWLPVAEDTVIDMSVSYFRKKGPDDKYARALVMQGAVYLEKGDYTTAIEAYKQAEPIVNASGDMLETGLLYTRMGELYQMSFANKAISIANYRKALECFKKARLSDNVMFGNLSLARVMLFDSTDAALPYIEEGLALARILDDRNMQLIGLELLTHYHDLKGNPRKVIDIAQKAVEIYDPDDEQLRPVIESILVCLTEAYADMDMPEKCIQTASLIDLDNCDRQMFHHIQSVLAGCRGDWKTAYEHKIISENLADSIIQAGYDMHLREVEKNYENNFLKERYAAMKSRYISYLMILICVICAVTACALLVYAKYLSIQRETEKSTDIIRSLSDGRMDTNEMRKEPPSIKESVAISEEMLKVTDELLEAYYKYGRTKAITGQVKDILEKHFPKDDTMTRVRKIVDATYPGFLSSLEKAHPSLKEKDIYVIALMACGFSTGTICALRRISESSLYVEKSRIAKKIGDNIRLSDYIANALKATKSS